MRLICKREAAHLTSLSVATIDRYVEDGSFVRKVYIGKWTTRWDVRRQKHMKYNTRVGFVEKEVLDWNLARIAKRDAKRDPALLTGEHATK